MNKKYLGPLIILAANFFFMGSFSLVKYISITVPVTLIMFARFFAGPLYLTPVMLAKKVPFKINAPYILAIRIVCGLTAMLCFFNAMSLGDIGKVTLIFEFSILWSVIGAMFLFKDHPSIQTKWAMPIAFIGLFMVIQPENLAGVSKSEWLALLGSVFNAGVYLSLKQLRTTDETMPIVWFTYIIASSIMIIPNLSMGFLPNAEQLLLLILMGSIGLMGQLCLTAGFKYSSASISSMIMLVSIPLMYISGYLFFGETINVLGIFGILTVFVSLGVITQYQ